MKRQFRSTSAARLELLRALQPPTLNGIDYLEIASKDQLKLTVAFVHDVVGIGKANCRIRGGVRIRDIHVLDAVGVGNQLQVTVDAAGDFSWYDFELIDPAAPEQPPADFDPCLSSLRFSFKAQCPADFDCADDDACPPPALTEPRLDYLAKDYASFRRLMLDRLGQLMPSFRQSNAADFNLALVELFSHVGDQLSYFQDAVATEAYLGTSRRRVSLRRHARLLDYAMHDGCNSRVLVAVAIDPAADGKVLAEGTAFFTRAETNAVESQAAGLETQAFQSLHELTLWSAHARIAIHTWGDPNYCLAKGSLQAALVDEPKLALEVGSLLILEEIAGPASGLAADADRSHRQAVRILSIEVGFDPLTSTALRIVTWHADDALGFALCVSKDLGLRGSADLRRIGVARGNVVLADHGFAYVGERLLPDSVPANGKYRPRLRETGLAYAVKYDHARAKKASASAALTQDPRLALPSNLQLIESEVVAGQDQALPGAQPWWPVRDLLDSDRFSKAFVVETENDGSAYLRFGDGRLGLAPQPGDRLLASYRVGGGRRGNVGAESITRVACDPGLLPFISSVRNPLPAQGGQEPESSDAVKLFAPEAFRTQERAVTEDDYARVAAQHPAVQRAAARLHWSGSWYTMFVSVDLKGGRALDDELRDELLELLDRYRLAGYDLDLSEPIYVPLDIELGVCVLPGYFASAVKQAVLRRLGTSDDAFGVRPFFHPDRFSFGQALGLSALVEATQSVPGVASVDVVRFQRWGKTANAERETGQIPADPLEVLRLDNDPNFPENGRLELDMRGGV